MEQLSVWWVVGGAAAVGLAGWLVRRALRAVVTLRARAFMPIALRRMAPWVRTYEYTLDGMVGADGMGEPWTSRRREALLHLTRQLDSRQGQARAWARAVRSGFSDLRFTDAGRVPFPFARVVREQFDLCSVVTASEGPRLRDLDGNWTIDVSGSYGVNVAGFDQYKAWIEQGWARVRDLGPVLGPLHPVVAENIQLLKQVSGLDEVSFHMSGTEAVMAAARMVRFATRRKLIVCFSGAYHGWWDGVQPGLGSERALDDCLTLTDASRASLDVIRWRASEIAGVIVNPVQAFHPNSPPPSDAVLMTSSVRTTNEAIEQYGAWLRELRAVCARHGVPFVLDEVYTGFRLAAGGAQQFFGLDADMVVYGKTVAGGMPIGVVCGRSHLMQRFDATRPMRLAYVVGTFSAHPLTMGAMREFLGWVTEPEAPARYDTANQQCAAWALGTNRALADAGLPLRVAHLGTIWTVLFTEPGRFNWLLQYYLRAQGVTLSWVGTGRCLFSLDFTPEDAEAVRTRLLAAARAMNDDGWWPTLTDHAERNARMRRRLIGEFMHSLVPTSVKAFSAAVMQRKHDDHHASHNDWGNQMLHLVSSSVFIYCYFIIVADLTTAMCMGLASLFVRQFGHAILEPACHEEEKLLLGYNTRNKTLIVLGYAVIPLAVMWQAGALSLQGFVAHIDPIALRWFQWTVLVVAGRVAYLAWKHDFRISMIWFVKLITDPFSDIVAYFPRWPQRA